MVATTVSPTPLEERSAPALRRWMPLALLAVLAFLVPGCAGPKTETHLAPIYTRLSLAGGDAELELAGGAVQVRFEGVTDQVKYWSFRPLYSWRRLEKDTTFSWILPPLGTRRKSPTENVTQVLPVMRYQENTHPDGNVTWSFLTLPGIYWAKRKDGRVIRLWFPIGGVAEKFFSFDRAEFALFPLYMRTKRHGRTTVHALFPFFSYSWGKGGNEWRAWPLAVHNKWEGRYDRWSALWPFFTYQRNGLNRPEEAQQTGWMIWPFFGKSTRGEARSWTTLWPFFGYTKDPRTGFWAWDGPWPLVVFQGGDPDRAVRKRVWPFYSYYMGDGLTSRYYAWPFYNVRHEENSEFTKDTRYLFPLWHGWTRTSKKTGLVSTWRKLWPLFRHYNNREEQRVLRAYPALNPFWRMQFVDEHYSWMWELWTEERHFQQFHQRSWLGLWRRETDLDEDRRSLVGLWARRQYLRNGRPTTETSMLFGLIRWRTIQDRGRQLMGPAFPGPGWPLQRTPSTLENMESSVPVPPSLP